MSIGRVLVSVGTLILAFTAWGQSPGVHLGELSWPEAERRDAATPILRIQNPGFSGMQPWQRR